MAFTGFTQVGYLTNKDAGTLILDVPVTGISAGDTVVVYVIHDNLGEANVIPYVSGGGHGTTWWDAVLDTYVSDDTLSDFRGQTFVHGYSYVHTSALSVDGDGGGNPQTISMACGLYTSTTSEDIRVAFPTEAKSKAVVVFKLSHTFANPVIPIFRDVNAAFQYYESTTAAGLIIEYDDYLDSQSFYDTNQWVFKLPLAEQFSMNMIGVDISGVGFTPNTPTGVTYQGIYGTSNAGSSSNRQMHIFTALGSATANRVNWSSTLDAAEHTISLSADVMYVFEFINWSDAIYPDNITMPPARTYMPTENADRWGSTPEILESTAGSDTFELPQFDLDDNFYIHIGKLAILNVCGSTSTPTISGMCSTWTLASSAGTGSDNLSVFYGEISVAEKITVAGVGTNMTASLQALPVPLTDILGDDNIQVVEDSGVNSNTTVTPTLTVPQSNDVVDRNQYFLHVFGDYGYTGTSTVTWLSGVSTELSGGTVISTSYSNQQYSYGVFDANTGDVNDVTAYATLSASRSGSQVLIGFELLNQNFTAGADVIITITDPFNNTVTLDDNIMPLTVPAFDNTETLNPDFYTWPIPTETLGNEYTINDNLVFWPISGDTDLDGTLDNSVDLQTPTIDTRGVQRPYSHLLFDTQAAILPIAHSYDEGYLDGTIQTHYQQFAGEGTEYLGSTSPRYALRVFVQKQGQHANKYALNTVAEHIGYLSTEYTLLTYSLKTGLHSNKYALNVVSEYSGSLYANYQLLVGDNFVSAECDMFVTATLADDPKTILGGITWIYSKATQINEAVITGVLETSMDSSASVDTDENIIRNNEISVSSTTAVYQEAWVVRPADCTMTVSATIIGEVDKQFNLDQDLDSSTVLDNEAAVIKNIVIDLDSTATLDIDPYLTINEVIELNTNALISLEENIIRNSDDFELYSNVTIDVEDAIIVNQNAELNSTTSIVAAPDITRNAETTMYSTTSISGDLTYYDNRDIIWFTGNITQAVPISVDIN